MIIKAPRSLNGIGENRLSVFLAGSIEMGKAEHWQKQLEDEFADREDIVLYNPRRESWDSSWVQDITNAQFEEQVEWELNAMEAADLIIMYFASETQSPVTLLELGLFARSGKLIVCCPEGFWRKGNVDIVCRKYGVQQVNTIEEIMQAIYLKSNTQ
jgi:hypothetical protein